MQKSQNVSRNVYEFKIVENKVRMEELEVQKLAEDLEATLKLTRSQSKFRTQLSQKSVTKKSITKPVRRSKTRSARKSVSGSNPSHPNITRDLQENGGGIQANSRLHQRFPANMQLPKFMTRFLTEHSSCHFCRREKVCEEKDCERCVNGDVGKACLGKTDCSMCHSNTGVFCRRCLKLRYGEDLETVRENKNWMCPHCSEERGIKPYWICNSLICLAIRKIPSIPIGISIRKAEEMGFECVADYVSSLLKGEQDFHMK